MYKTKGAGITGRQSLLLLFLDYALYTPVNNALSIAQFATMLFILFFMKKFGKHRTYQLGLLGMILGFAGTGICGTNVSLLIVFNALKGIGLGAAENS